MRRRSSVAALAVLFAVTTGCTANTSGLDLREMVRAEVSAALVDSSRTDESERTAMAGGDVDQSSRNYDELTLRFDAFGRTVRETKGLIQAVGLVAAISYVIPRILIAWWRWRKNGRDRK